MTFPPRLVPLLKQFDDGRDRLIGRLHGLTDEEYLWEPAAFCWSLRRREACQTRQAFGKGSWVMDFDRPEPVTTIAWRICHLTNDFLQRTDYTIGSKALAWDDYEVLPTAQEGVSALATAAQSWREVLISTTEEQLDQVGRSQLPWGLDPRLPFLDIIWWVNQELLSHGAEIALLRDLYRGQAL
jgi:hypothetical protein